MSARFSIEFSPGETPFIIELHDAEKIKHARRIVSGEEKIRVHVQGTIVKAKANYNPDYSYHLDPATIDFFEFAIEVCDAAPSYVEENLDDIGGALLPGNGWCPWTSRVAAEVP
jgi:hypothetical protein